MTPKEILERFDEEYYGNNSRFDAHGRGLIDDWKQVETFNAHKIDDTKQGDFTVWEDTDGNYVVTQAIVGKGVQAVWLDESAHRRKTSRNTRSRRRRSESRRRRTAASYPRRAVEVARGVAALEDEEEYLDDVMFEEVDLEIQKMSFDELIDYLDASPNENAFFDEGLGMNADSVHEALQQFAFFAMRMDVRQKLNEMGVGIR